MSKAGQKQQNAYSEYMNRVVDVEDEVFDNNRDLLTSPNKKRSSKFIFIEDVDTTNIGLKRKKKSVINHVNTYNDIRLLKQILQTLINFQDEQRLFNIKQEFFRTVFENKELRSMELKVVNFPFTKTSAIPENIELPLIRSAEGIDQLTHSQVKLYLQAYAIAFNNSWPRKRLKELLRNKLGFTCHQDLTVSMS